MNHVAFMQEDHPYSDMWDVNDALKFGRDFKEYLLFLHVSALISLIMLVFSYFMMRNAPLERGDRKVFKVSAVN